MNQDLLGFCRSRPFLLELVLSRHPGFLDLGTSAGSRQQQSRQNVTNGVHTSFLFGSTVGLAPVEPFQQQLLLFGAAFFGQQRVFGPLVVAWFVIGDVDWPVAACENQQTHRAE
jgi:hypothetical protein